jgi:hypothetical protein
MRPGTEHLSHNRRYYRVSGANRRGRPPLGWKVKRRLLRNHSPQGRGGALRLAEFVPCPRERGLGRLLRWLRDDIGAGRKLAARTLRLAWQRAPRKDRWRWQHPRIEKPLTPDNVRRLLAACRRGWPVDNSEHPTEREKIEHIERQRDERIAREEAKAAERGVQPRQRRKEASFVVRKVIPEFFTRADYRHARDILYELKPELLSRTRSAPVTVACS